ncbi:MAG: GNAT family N-acetyltransferase [Actinomycetota bacterium]|nr:GNAT family N-acetyltransferase [Actinomycetota bacterium]
MIVRLAEYERAPEKVTGTEQMLGRALFGPAPSAEAVIAEIDGLTVGFALFYSTFSTWECLPGIWLEDLFVPPEHRRAGVGAALLQHLARLAVERGCARLEWTALDWNTPALNFYAKLGADVLAEWKTLRLDGAALAGVAGGTT